MSEKIRVTFVRVSHGAFAGASKMLLRLMNSLDDSAFVPKLISQHDDELCRRARDCGIEVSIIPYRGSLDKYDGQLFQWKNVPPASIRAIQYNYEIAEHLKGSDVIWCQNSRVVMTLAPYLAVSDQPTIWNIGLGLESKGAMSFIHAACFRLADRVFIESETQAKNVFSTEKFERHRDKFEIFHKGIDTREFDPDTTEPLITRDNFLIGTAASITPRKGIEYLIDAVGALSNEHQVDLVIAGDAPNDSQEYKKELERRIDEYGLEERVEFLGWVEDMPSFLHSLDVFVLPSLNEGVPGAVREALAMGVPVIATDVGGTSDVVIDDRTGYLVSPKNSVQISEKLAFLIENENKRLELASSGKKLIENEHSLDDFIKNYKLFFIFLE